MTKVIPLSIVIINKFDYRGNVPPEVIQTALINFINNISDGNLEISDLVNEAYKAGADSVNLSNLTITVKDQNYLGNYIKTTLTSSTSSYKLKGRLKSYFADIHSTYGVTKIE